MQGRVAGAGLSAAKEAPERLRVVKGLLATAFFSHAPGFHTLRSLQPRLPTGVFFEFNKP